MEIREKFEIYFNLVEDNRRVSHIKYKLSDILFLLMCSTLCGCNDIEMILEFAEERLEFFTDYLADWKGLKKIFAVKREIEINGIKTTETSCYLSSKNTTAAKLLSYTRKHWQIESFHWLLDMHYDEDDSRVRHKNSQLCLNIMRKYAISILKKYIENNEVKRKTIIGNMRKCMFNPEYLTSVLKYYCNS